MNTIERFEHYLKQEALTVTSLSLDALEDFLETAMLDREALIELFRHLKDKNTNLYVYGLTMLGRLGVLESIMEKAQDYGLEGTFNYPDTGVPTKHLWKAADDMTAYLKCQLKGDALKVLAGNHHRIPDEAFAGEKVHYQESKDLSTYLKDRHERKVAELQDHADKEKIWYEQVITQAVVDFVAANPEMLSAVYKDNALYITKIPYDTVAYLEGTDPVMKRYHYCHCGFVKSAIKAGHAVDPDWCHCSAGFAKRPFEVMMERDLEVEVLESVLNGDDRCRFKVKL